MCGDTPAPRTGHAPTRFEAGAFKVTCTSRLVLFPTPTRCMRLRPTSTGDRHSLLAALVQSTPARVLEATACPPLPSRSSQAAFGSQSYHLQAKVLECTICYLAGSAVWYVHAAADYWSSLPLHTNTSDVGLCYPQKRLRVRPTGSEKRSC
jgi:hypothetical protein